MAYLVFYTLNRIYEGILSVLLSKNQQFKVLDLFCKAGGASYGMFWTLPKSIHITGVDNEIQNNYPFNFIKADYREIDLSRYNFIWASPPCQIHSKITPKNYKQFHIDLIPDVRNRLINSGIDYCIENVPGSTLKPTLKLHGGMFGEKIKKLRYFETSFFILNPGEMKSINFPLSIAGPDEKKYRLDWMTIDESRNAVPPIYSYYILSSYFEQKFCNRYSWLKDKKDCNINSPDEAKNLCNNEHRLNQKL